MRQARRDIDQVIEQLKGRSEQLLDQAAQKARASGLSTGDTGAARTEAREAIERIVSTLKEPAARATRRPRLLPAR